MNTEHLPKRITEKIEIENEQFSKYLITYKETYDHNRNLFLRTEPFALTNNTYGVNWLTVTYHSLCLFPDDEIFQKFNEFGIKKSELRWMDGIDAYIKCFEEIERSEAIVYRNEFMIHLYLHLLIHISLDVFKWSEFPRRATYSLTTDLENARERLGYDAKRKYKPSKQKEGLDIILKEMRSLSNQGVLNETELFKLLKGEIPKSFYLTWLRESFPYKDEVLKSNKFLNIVSPIFRLIFKDQDWPKEDYLGKSTETTTGQFLRKLFFKK